MDFAPLHAAASVRLSREAIIHKYLHLVKYVAGRISVALPANVEINDLINDGVFGLIDAIEKYDETRAVKFETYAITRINGAILDALRSLDWVPRTVRHRVREVERAYEALEWELGRAPSDGELAERLRMSKHELDVLRQRMNGTALISLEEPHVSDTLEDRESDVTTEIEREEMRAELVAAVESLPLPERTVIRRYYFKGETLREIRGALGVSESRVSQIHAKAVQHLRQRLREL
ncbi:MAG: FliA/WhiG family RNA polymerase sigma factor [Candidatus Cybelea sp.]